MIDPGIIHPGTAAQLVQTGRKGSGKGSKISGPAAADRRWSSTAPGIGQAKRGSNPQDLQKFRRNQHPGQVLHSVAVPPGRVVQPALRRSGDIPEAVPPRRLGHHRGDKPAILVSGSHSSRKAGRHPGQAKVSTRSICTGQSPRSRASVKTSRIPPGVIQVDLQVIREARPGQPG